MDKEKRASLARATRLFTLMVTLDRTVRDGFKRGAGMPYELTIGQYEILTLIADAGPQTQRSLAGALGVTGPTIVRMVDALEKKDLARRARDGKDRRLVFVSLTEQGREAQAASTGIHEERVAAASAHLSPDMLDAVLDSISAYLAVARTTRDADAA